MNYIKEAFVTTLLLGVVGYVGSVSAHEQNGALGKAASATDYYQVTCSDDGNGPADRLIVQIKDVAPAVKPLVSVLIINGLQAQNTTDAVDGDATGSPALNIKGKTTTYYMLVSKTAAGVETYSLDYHCLTLSGAHTGTDIFPFQNQ